MITVRSTYRYGVSICGQRVQLNVKFKSIGFPAAKRADLSIRETSVGCMTGSPNPKTMTLVPARI